MYKGIYTPKNVVHCTSKGQDSKCDNWLNYNLTEACYTTGIYTPKMKSRVYAAAVETIEIIAGPYGPCGRSFT